MLQLLDLLELLGFDHGAVHIHDDDPKIPIRQIKWIGNRILHPIDHDLTAAPQDPERDLTLLGECNLGHERQPQQTEDETNDD